MINITQYKHDKIRSTRTYETNQREYCTINFCSGCKFELACRVGETACIGFRWFIYGKKKPNSSSLEIQPGTWDKPYGIPNRHHFDKIFKGRSDRT